MKILHKLSYFLVSMLISGSVFAHEGHDHNHWSSDSLHLLFYTSFLLMVTFGMAALIKFVLNNIKVESKE
ncbi:MAG: hypothetical protein ABJK37_24495 [Paraglaciecola sp.]|uniref:hypothetical protein n=1 Tax=Paraglaciecola sp. TaxID=1920173 RepID=UPI00329A6E58